MHYLVTGGAGFIGSHLCDTLLSTGHQVTVVDDLSTGRRDNLSENVTLIEGDCGDAALIAPIIDAMDGVYHLAAIASVQKSREAWCKTSEINQMATITLLEVISKRETAIPFVYASSAAVYGDPDASYLPINEKTPTKPLTPYGADKLGSELHAHVGSHLFGIPTLGLRFFNVYGPRQDPSSPYSGVISIFAERIRNEQPVTIFGDGEQTRDFIYVSDVVAHLMAAMHIISSDNGANISALNVCTGESISVNALADMLGELCEQELQIDYAAPREGDIRASVGDALWATNYLNISAGTPLRKGLSQTLDWLART